MKINKVSVICMTVLLTAGFATANTVWNPINPDPNFPASPGNWDVAANWTNGIPGVTDQKPVFNVVGAAECQVTTATLPFGDVDNGLVMGDGSGSPDMVLRVMDGGTITKNGGGWSGLGYNADGGTLIVEEGGSVVLNSHLWFGLNAGGIGRLVINGGTVEVADAIDLGRNAGGLGFVTIDSGGTLTARYLPDLNDNVGSLGDIRFGTFILEGGYGGSQKTNLDARIAAGTWVGFGGDGALNIAEVGGDTHITATDPMNRTPGYDGIVIGAGTTTLSWTNLTPVPPATSVWVDVWFGTDTGTWTEVDNGFAGETSVSVTVAEGDYVWKVDSYLYGNPGSVQYDLNDNDPNFPPVVRGTILPFNVVADAPPTIVIDTPDKLTWAGEPVTLIATVTDDGVSASAVAWSSPADANIVYSAESYVYPTATVTVTSDSHQPNTTITATVTDGNPLLLDDSDTVLVDFAEDACQGAGGGFQNLWDVYQADYNNDCIIDLYDFAQMAAQWIDDYALTGPIPIVPVP